MASCCHFSCLSSLLRIGSRTLRLRLNCTSRVIRVRPLSISSGSMAETVAAKDIVPGQARVGWIGIGVMGQAMASHIVAAGFQVTDRDFAPGFYVNHFVKDLGMALDECRNMGLALPGLALAQ